MTHQPLNTEEVYDELRHAILEKLRQGTGRDGTWQFEIGSNEVSVLLPEFENPDRYEQELGSLVCQIYHELYLERIIAPGVGQLNSTGRMEWPWYRLTDHGKRVLQTIEYSPYDPNGYLRRLREEIPDIDETIIRYLEESLRCLRMDCLLAAAVTIGCAAEKAMLLLIERFGETISDPAKKKKYEKATSDWRISKKYEAFRKCFQDIMEKLPNDLGRQRESHLDGAFNLIRRVRNSAGHPSGEPITREMVIANQAIFPGYCKYVYSLMDHFGKEGVNS